MHSPYPSPLPTRPPSFPKATRALSAALTKTSRQAERLEADFTAETQSLHYAGERVLAGLWRVKVGFCGWQGGGGKDDRDGRGEDGRGEDEDEEEDEENVEFGRGERRGGGGGEGRAADDESSFAVCARGLLDAIEDLKVAGRAWGRREEGAGFTFSSSSGRNSGDGHGGVGLEDVRHAMKKLSVSFGALAELLEGVRVEKSRCPVLVRELRSAQDVLLGIRRVWGVPSRNGGRRRDNFSTAATAGGSGKIPVAAFVEDWENSSYRGE